ncbi:substrate-binding domain-containing protein [Secundilactobacillus silagei]|uniref:substrate-binding domain-containing protein n=1 Tax=Secundilactobacillus silagei TaxID=1293415 RepID=UPI0006D2AD7C|nr:substrate-binding domain-containing protein [Secundilactobacillus silagei]
MPLLAVTGWNLAWTVQSKKKGDDLRTQAYRDWLAVNHQSKLMKLTSWNTQAGLSAINELLSEVTAPIGGLLVASDSMAIGVVKGLLERQIVPGKDLPLISFDNIHVASFLTPAITSFSLPKEVLGITAVNQICDLITHHRQWISRTTIPGHLGTGETYPLQTC